MRTIWTFSFILTSLYITIFATLHHHGTGKYTNTWVVEVIDDHPDTVRKVTEELGLHYHGPVGSLKNIHVVQHKTLESGLNKTSDEHHKKIVFHDKVLYARQEQILNRKKRGYIRSDPDYKKQWFLKNTGQTRHLCNGELYDINVEPVWREGITGRGVVVAILDDGLEYTHPDLKRNFNNVSSFNFNSRPYSKDPIPRATPDDLNKHGTRCAGEVAAERDNGVCGRGVAYNAQVAGIRMLDGEVSDAIEAGSLSYRRDLIDIYSSSWGPDDDGYTVDGPGRLTRRALSEGISKGRNGLGSIFVWATGNGGGLFDYCSCDGYINSPYTISIGAVNNCGHKPWYSEPCPGTLAVTFSSGETSRERRDLQIVTTDLHKKCTDLHTGTSAAAPLAAGIFALVLEANPKLTWRDLQHLIVHTSRKVHPSDSGWKENGAGLIVNENFGFGSLDAKALVDAARDPNWKTADTRKVYETPVKYVGLHRVPRSQSEIISKIPFSQSTNGVCINKLEHVHAIVSLRLSKQGYRGNRGKHSIKLISPQGTESNLLLQRPRDYFHGRGRHYAFREWEFMTVFNWDENPEGIWTLKMKDHTPYSYSSWAEKTHLSWKLRLSGTCKQIKWPYWNFFDSHGHK